MSRSSQLCLFFRFSCTTPSCISSIRSIQQYFLWHYTQNGHRPRHFEGPRSLTDKQTDTHTSHTHTHTPHTQHTHKHTTHTHKSTHTRIQQDSSGRVIISSQWPLSAQHAKNTRDAHTYLQRDSKPRSQLSSSRGLTMRATCPAHFTHLYLMVLIVFGHVQRMEGNRFPKRVLYMNLATTILNGRPRNR